MEAFSALLALCAGIHRSPVNSPHKAQWRGALMFSSSCALINGWVHTLEAGDLRRHHPHYDVTVMTWVIHYAYNIPYMKWTYIIIHMYCVQKQNNIALRCLCYLNPSFRFIIAKWNLFFVIHFNITSHEASCVYGGRVYVQLLIWILVDSSQDVYVFTYLMNTVSSQPIPTSPLLKSSVSGRQSVATVG